MTKDSNPRQKFQGYVTKTLAEHTIKLENIEKTLDRLQNSLPVESNRVGQLEQKFQFFRGISYFLMGMLGVFISLIALFAT